MKKCKGCNALLGDFYITRKLACGHHALVWCGECSFKPAFENWSAYSEKFDLLHTAICPALEVN